MKAVILAGLACLLLAGCSTTGKVPTIVEKPTNISIPNEFYLCPTVNQLPDPDTLTNAQLARLIVSLDSNNQTCKNSLDTIKAYVKKVNAKVK